MVNFIRVVIATGAKDLQSAPLDMTCLSSSAYEISVADILFPQFQGTTYTALTFLSDSAPIYLIASGTIRTRLIHALAKARAYGTDTDTDFDFDRNSCKHGMPQS